MKKEAIQVTELCYPGDGSGWHRCGTREVLPREVQSLKTVPISVTRVGMKDGAEFYTDAEDGEALRQGRRW